MDGGVHGFLGVLESVLRLLRAIHFTNEGRVFVILMAGIGAGAVNTGNNLLYLLLSSMLALVVLNWIWAGRVLRNLEIWRKPPAEIYAGQETYIRLGVRNAKDNVTARITIREHFGKGRSLEAVEFDSLGPHATEELGYHCIFPRRGRCRFRGWVVETSFPFGLIRRSRYQVGEDSAVVYPRTDLPLELPLFLGQGDGIGISRKGHGEELYALREHRPGDDHRRVAWKASARRGVLVAKEFSDSSTAEISIALANVSDVRGRDPLFESSLDHAASVASRLLEMGFSVGLVMLDHVQEPSDQLEELSQLLEGLALAKQLKPEEAEPLRAGFSAELEARCVIIETESNRAFRPPVSEPLMITVTAKESVIDDLPRSVS